MPYESREEKLERELKAAKAEVVRLRAEQEKLERYKQYSQMTDEVYGMYQCYLASGFNEKQAFELLKVTIAQAAQMQKR